jgi:hypothetical protein
MAYIYMDMKLQEIDFHRNGVSGKSFYVIRFTARPNGGPTPQNFIGVVFDFDSNTVAVDPF